MMMNKKQILTEGFKVAIVLFCIIYVDTAILLVVLILLVCMLVPAVVRLLKGV